MVRLALWRRMRDLNVLLVGPDYRSATGWTSPSVAPGIVVDIAPLVLATLAALVPPNVHVDVWDEPVDGREGGDVGTRRAR